MFQSQNQLLEVMKRIKEIDREHNGYVTSTELTDIMHISLPSLKAMHVAPLLRPYASIANKVLIDYKRFRDDIVKSMQEHKDHKDKAV